jgi:hypothetical protein
MAVLLPVGYFHGSNVCGREYRYTCVCVIKRNGKMMACSFKVYKLSHHRYATKAFNINVPHDVGFFIFRESLVGNRVFFH